MDDRLKCDRRSIFCRAPHDAGMDNQEHDRVFADGYFAALKSVSEELAVRVKLAESRAKQGKVDLGPRPRFGSGEIPDGEPKLDHVSAEEVQPGTFAILIGGTEVMRLEDVRGAWNPKCLAKIDAAVRAIVQRAVADDFDAKVNAAASKADSGKTFPKCHNGRLMPINRTRSRCAACGKFFKLVHVPGVLSPPNNPNEEPKAWQPMSPTRDAGRWFRDLSTDERMAVRGLYPGWSDSELYDMKWEQP